MTKQELVHDIAQQTGVKTDDVLTIVESFMEQVKTANANGVDVTLRGFGTFHVHKRPQRVARDLGKGGIPIVIPSQNTVKFKPSKEFREAVK